MDRLRRFMGLSPANRWLLIQACLILLLVVVLTRLLPFSALRSLLARVSRADRATRERRPHSVETLVWATKTASRYLLVTSCLKRALLVYILLWRNGHSANLRIGVTLDEEKRGFAAHAWVENEGKVVVGKGAGISRYKVIYSQGGS